MAHGRKKPRQPRILRNPIERALHGATALTDSEQRTTIAPAIECLRRLREGTATDDQHTVVYTVLTVASGIEERGIVRGLSTQFALALRSLDDIRARATAAGAWRAPTLYARELAAIDEAVFLHRFQLQKVSAGELHAIATKTIARHRSAGGIFQRTTAREIGLSCYEVAA